MCQSPASEQRCHLLLALRGAKVIEDWIQTAAKAAYTHGEQVCLVGTVTGLVGQLNIVNHEDDVGGGEADHKHHQHDHGHHHGSRLLGTVLHIGCSQSLNNSYIADNSEEQRDEEKQAGVDWEEVKIVSL